MNLSDVLRDRFSESYQHARLLSRGGKIISRLSLVLTVVPFMFGVSEAEEGRMGAIFLLWALSAMLALVGYGIGKVVIVQSRVLSSLIDLGVNSSGALSEVTRAELLAEHDQQGKQSIGLNLVQHTVGAIDPRASQHPGVELSPIAALIAQPISTYSHFTPLQRSERRLARPGRRRHH